jgi:hypothetical protein
MMLALLYDGISLKAADLYQSPEGDGPRFGREYPATRGAAEESLGRIMS